MAKPPARRQSFTLLPDLLDWPDAPWAPLLPFAGGHMMRVEAYVKDNNYVVRVELPGMDPGKDVEITVEDGMLSIHAVSVPVAEAKPEGRRIQITRGS